MLHAFIGTRTSLHPLYELRLSHACRSALSAASSYYLVLTGTPGLLSLPTVQRRISRFSAMSTKASAATLEVATKQNVGAPASKSQTHVGLNSGHIMPLLGWGTSQATGDECIKATKAAIEAGFRVSHVHNMAKCDILCMQCVSCSIKSFPVRPRYLTMAAKFLS